MLENLRYVDAVLSLVFDEEFEEPPKEVVAGCHVSHCRLEPYICSSRIRNLLAYPEHNTWEGDPPDIPSQVAAAPAIGQRPVTPGIKTNLHVHHQT